VSQGRTPFRADGGRQRAKLIVDDGPAYGRLLKSVGAVHAVSVEAVGISLDDVHTRARDGRSVGASAG
jgi:hypothetical protein